MAPVALIFDLDGTVWDSAGWYAIGIADEGDAAGVDRLAAHFRGGGNLVRTLKECGVSRSRLIKQAADRAGPPPLFPGMGEAIAALKEQIPLGIATSLPGSIALPMLDLCGLAASFSAVVHAGDCRTPKPNPAPIMMALQRLGQVADKRAYYVGDRQVDATAATRAGISMAWVAHGYEGAKCGPGIVVVQSGELLDL